MMCISPTDTLCKLKFSLRLKARDIRDSLETDCRSRDGQELARRLISLPEIERARMVMCYMSFRSEVPTDEIIVGLKSMGKRLCFPVCESGGVMHAFSPACEEAWKKGKMGIMEPDIEKSTLILPEEIDIVICPLLAFDEKRQRLGYGGGYYDRYLPGCKNAISIGLAFEAQKIDAVPADKFDIPLDIILTEKRRY